MGTQADTTYRWPVRLIWWLAHCSLDDEEGYWLLSSFFFLNQWRSRPRNLNRDFFISNEYQEMSDMTRSHTLVWQVSQVGGGACDESEMNLCLSLTLLLVFGLALVLILKHYIVSSTREISRAKVNMASLTSWRRCYSVRNFLENFANQSDINLPECHT